MLTPTRSLRLNTEEFLQAVVVFEGDQVVVVGSAL